MKQYVDLVRHILDHGEVRPDRTGTGSISVFAGHVAFDLRERFPLVTCKETRWKVAFLEMLWFLRGEQSTWWLNNRKCKLWDAWADESGFLGPIYGYQWRNFNGAGLDQVRGLINGIRENPFGRRHIVTAWNPIQLNKMALPPCHWAHQCNASADGEWLDMQVYQRSWDVALGAPFNIAQYALLLHLYARATNRKARHLHFSYGDAHLYLNHTDAMRKVIEDGPVEDDRSTLLVHTRNTEIDGYVLEDFDIVGYAPKPFVKLEVSV